MFTCGKRIPVVFATFSSNCIKKDVTPIAFSSNFKIKKKREPAYFEKNGQWRNDDEFFDDIANSKLYEDDHVVAVLKPNAVAMAGTVYRDLPQHIRPTDLPNDTIASILPRLKEHYNCDFLKEVYSQPRLYSGPVVFAKSEIAFQKLKNYFKTVKTFKEPSQTYLVVSIGIPNAEMSPVSFPVLRQKIRNENLSMKLLEFSKNMQKKRGVMAVSVIEHHVVDKRALGSGQHVKVSLNNIKLTQVKWDMIECYMVDHCLCPVLGDHVYSSRLSTLQNRIIRLSPHQCDPKTQELPYEVSSALGVESVKDCVNKLPLHVHCSEVEIPNLSLRHRTKRYPKNSLLKIRAPLPEFYKETLSRLGLNYSVYNSDVGT